MLRRGKKGTTLRRRSCRQSPLVVEALEERMLLSATYRSIDGTGNNLDNPDWGSAGTQLLRNTTNAYADGISAPVEGRPNPRLISNIINAQGEDIFNDRHLTQFLFQWGQFIDHDLDLTEEAIPNELFNIPIDPNDPDLDISEILVLRSRFDPETGINGIPREQINQITSFIDGSQVYGSDEVRAAALRTFVGGLLKTSDGNLLPYNTVGLHNAGPPPLGPSDYFLAGDIRSNEQPGLTALHTLFVREHNRLAAEIAASDFAGQDLSDAAVDEEIYQRARRLVIAEIQVITYREFLPALLGHNALGSYDGYDSTVNPSVANIFSAALYRIGHTMLPNLMTMMNDDLTPNGPGDVGLGDVFFQPGVTEEFGIEPFLMGLGATLAQEIDNHVVDGVRNLLFDPPAQFDLAAINMQRAREHGLPGYNQVRRDFGLEAYTSFDQITSDPELAAAFRLAYGVDADGNDNIELVDPWVGAISEDHVPGASVGELMQTVLVDQFRRTRDGDRFFYANQFSGAELAMIENTTLADIIRRNTTLTNLQDHIFFDRTVLYYQVPSGSGSTNLYLDAIGQHLVLIDLNTGQQVAKKLLSETSQVILAGNDGVTDRFVINLRGVGGTLADGVIVHGGEGGHDLVVVLGSFRDKVTRIDDTHVQVGDIVYELNDVEHDIILAGNPFNFLKGQGLVQDLLQGKGQRPDGRMARVEQALSSLARQDDANQDTSSDRSEEDKSERRGKAAAALSQTASSKLESIFNGSLLDRLL